MDFTTIQRIWTGDAGGRPSEPPAEAVVAQVVRKDRQLARKTRARDVLELGPAAVMALGFGWVGLQVPTAWPWWLATVITIGVGAVFVWERWRARTRRRAEVADLRAGLRAALAEADHQIGLLGSVLWWYLLPLACVAVLVVAGTLLDVRAAVGADAWSRGGAVLMAAFGATFVVVGALFWVVWRLNVRAVTRHLQPYRDELAAVITQLDSVAGVVDGAGDSRGAESVVDVDHGDA
jgi:hypothetical protein